MPESPAPSVAEEFRAAIRHRSELPPGSAAHWRAICEVKRLQRLLLLDTAADVGSPSST